jgi:hypothetical protein
MDLLLRLNRGKDEDIPHLMEPFHLLLQLQDGRREPSLPLGVKRILMKVKEFSPVEQQCTQ